MSCKMVQYSDVTVALHVESSMVICVCMLLCMYMIKTVMWMCSMWIEHRYVEKEIALTCHMKSSYCLTWLGQHCMICIPCNPYLCSHYCIYSIHVSDISAGIPNAVVLIHNPLIQWPVITSVKLWYHQVHKYDLENKLSKCARKCHLSRFIVSLLNFQNGWLCCTVEPNITSINLM